MNIKIKGFHELSMTDWPGVISVILFAGGCNFHCFYCHNATLAFSPDTLEDIPHEYIFKKLEIMKEWIEGVVISGGEPTIYGEGLKALLTKIKDMGFKTKLYTNGTNPELLKELVNHKLLDAISLDIKHRPGFYNKVVGDKCKGLEEKVWKTLKYLMGVDMETYFRTTVIKGIHKPEDLIEIKKLISPKKFILQNVQNTGVEEANKNFIQSFTLKEFEELEKIVMEGL